MQWQQVGERQEVECEGAMPPVNRKKGRQSRAEEKPGEHRELISPLEALIICSIEDSIKALI